MLTTQSVGRSQLPTHLPMRVTKLAAAKPNHNYYQPDFIGQTIERDRIHLITKRIELNGYCVDQIIVCRNMPTDSVRHDLHSDV